MSNRLDQARSQWGRVFSEFYLACEMSNAARFEVADLQVLKGEEIQRLRSLIKNVQQRLNDWEKLSLEVLA